MKVLFLTHRLPYAPNRGDRARAFHIVRTLITQVDLELVSLAHDAAEMREVTRLHALGVRARAFRTAPVSGYLRGGLNLVGTRPLTHCLLDAPGLRAYLREVVRTAPPDVVLAFCSGMARFAMEEPLAGYPMVLDMVDVDSAKWALLSKTSRWPASWIYRREARFLSRFERASTTRAVTTLVVSAREQATLQQLAPGADVRVMQLGVDLANLGPTASPTESPRVVFCGVMNYAPNVEGVLWFAREVWPLVRAARRDARFIVVGAKPPEAIARLGTPGLGIEVTVTVDDVRTYLWGAAVSVAPLLTARGTQNKVLEALATGLPCVVTNAVAAGLPDTATAGCRVADSPQVFSRDVVALLAMTGAERRAVAARAALDRLSWDSQLAPLPQILEAAAKRGTR